MSTWIESHTSLRFHKKMKPLCDALKIVRPQAIGHLHSLWWWAIENREDGDLKNLQAKDIAFAADWDGDPEFFIKQMIATGWITKELKIVDWMDYAGRLLKERDRKRKSRTRDIQEEMFGADAGAPFNLAEIWNDTCLKLPKVIIPVSEARAKKIRSRIREVPSEKTWREIFQRINESRFCCGENERGWQATFDWIIENDMNHSKVREGRYENRNVPAKAQNNKHLSPAVREELSRRGAVESYRATA